jgi:polyisoprenoid-binding protein YceI
MNSSRTKHGQSPTPVDIHLYGYFGDSRREITYGQRMTVSSGRLRFGPDNGRLLLRTGRDGVGKSIGHDLIIEVTDWSGHADIPETGPRQATIVARFELGSLTVREGRGGVRTLTDKDRRQIERNARVILDVDDYPTVTFESTGIGADVGGHVINGTLTVHGAAGQIDVRVHETRPGQYRGTAVVTQSAYGIRPYSAFLGALKVRDDVEVEIELDLGDRRSGR